MISRSICKIVCGLTQDLYCRVCIGIHRISNRSLPVGCLLNNTKKLPSYSTEKLIPPQECVISLKIVLKTLGKFGFFLSKTVAACDRKGSPRSNISVVWSLMV